MADQTAPEDLAFPSWDELLSACADVCGFLTEERGRQGGEDRKWLVTASLGAEPPAGDGCRIDVLSHGPEGAADLGSIRLEARVPVTGGARFLGDGPVVLGISAAAETVLSESVSPADPPVPFPEGPFVSADTGADDLRRLFAAAGPSL